MKYYFVGCSWGKGNKDFFQLMKDRNVVITANKANLLKDYYVAIKRGTKIIAVAKINNNSKHYSDCSFGLTDKELNDNGINISDNPVIAQVSNLVELEHPVEYETQSGSGARIRKEETIKQLDKIMKPEEMITEYEALLRNSKNIILTGAPGTGKTFLAKTLAIKITNKNNNSEDASRIDFVQFHPSFDYTDFVEGIRPSKSKNEDSNVLYFEHRDGIFKKFCKKAIDNKDNDYCFVIDEINRGDLGKIFGELFFSIDPDYRGEKGSVTTQYQNLISTDNDNKQDVFKKGFYVPENVYIIGTMNDIDRSVESMDFAIRRRFTFVEVPVLTDDSKISREQEQIFESMKIDQKTKEIIKNRFISLNKAIKDSKDLGEQFEIGAAYFKNIKKDKDFDELWNYRLKPLLKEYLRGRKDISDKLARLKEGYEGNNED